MGQSLAIPRVIPNDWKRLDLIVSKIKMRLGSAASPTFAGITITGLTASSLVGTNASKALESVTVGTGLDYTRPTLSLSHLGIEALTDPGADKILFWDDTALVCKWLGMGNSIAITDVTLDTIQDIRITATPTFNGLISTGVVQATDFAKTGWPITTGATFSFSYPTFTVTDGGSAYYYIGGVKYTLGGNKTVDITDTEGLWYIYFDGATLTASQTIWSFRVEDKALVAILYWDAANDEIIFLGWEAHTFHMDGSTHARLHYAGGARWETGLLVSDTGSETVNVSAGDIWDEDLNIAITDGAGSSLFEQVLSPAELPIYYLDGASNWRIYETGDKANATDIGYVDGSNDLKYNKLNGTWANATVGLNNYVAYYVIATNEQAEPVALIMGQRTDNKLSDAKENNVFSGLTLTGLPFQEMVVLARLILKDTATYTLEEVLDLRVFNIKGNITSPLIPDHGGLAGLGDDDHPQYIKDSEFTQDSGVLVGTAAGTFQEETGATLRTSLGLAIGTNVQAHGDVLDDLNTLGANPFTGDPANDFLVGTAAGTLAWQSGATARASLGLTVANLTETTSNVLTVTGGTGCVIGTGTTIEVGLAAPTSSDTTHLSTAAQIWNWGASAFSVLAHRHLTQTLTHDGVNSSGGAFSFTTTGKVTFSQPIVINALFLNEIADAGTDVDGDGQLWVHDDTPCSLWFTTDAGNDIQLTSGTGVVIGSHLHDGHTLECDAINSDAGSFAFTTGGLVTFSEAITMSAGKDLTVAGHIIFNTNNSYIGFTNPRITFNDTGNQAEVTGALTVSSTALVSGASVTVGTASTTTGTLVLHDSNSANTITLTVPDISAGSLTFTLPPTDGDNLDVLQTDGNGVLTWVANPGAAHAMLDGSTHNDSVADTISRGSLIYGNSTPKWDELDISTGFLRGDGTDCGWLSYANSLAALSGVAGAAFDFNSQALTSVGAIGCGAVTGTSTATFEGASVTVGKASTTTGTIVLHDSNSANTITLTVPDISAGSLSFTLPPTDGDNTEVLQTDGNGVLTWVANAGGGASTWIDLTDTDPANYTGSAGKAVVVNAGEDGLEFGPIPSGSFTSKCSVYKNATQAITTGTWTKVQLNTEDYDIDGEFDSVTNYRFQPGSTGYYHVDIGARLESIGDGKKASCALYKNGVEYRRADDTLGIAGSVVGDISCDMYLLSTDYIELWVWHNHGSNRNTSGSRSTFMNVHRIAGGSGNYVDRGNSSAGDFDEGDGPTETTWTDLDLGPGGLAIVPANTKAVALLLKIKDNAASKFVRVRKNGSTSDQPGNAGAITTQVANIAIFNNVVVGCDTDGIIEYYLATDVDAFSITVTGWWV